MTDLSEMRRVAEAAAAAKFGPATVVTLRPHEMLALLDVVEAGRKWEEHVALNGGCHAGCPEHDAFQLALAALSRLESL